MTSEFRPGKAYYIKGKRPEEVKHGVEEWFKMHDLATIDTNEEIIDVYEFTFTSELWLRLKIIENSKGTFIVYDNRLFKNELHYHHLGVQYSEEIRKDLVRYLQGKKELVLGRFDSYHSRFDALAIILFIPIYFTFLFSNYLFHDITTRKIVIILAFIYFTVGSFFGLYFENQLDHKIEKLANLPEYKVEEYEGEIRID
ncbi:MAG: hypothetical protein GYA51_10515 [Candidatus Methanofastidiosa archaeon]|jgi:hypothetical protein|nr:hypothetical protein [Candidatus Methanofastidiosa archaeon]